MTWTLNTAYLYFLIEISVCSLQINENRNELNIGICFSGETKALFHTLQQIVSPR